MKTFKLEKEIKLYKSQFDSYIQTLFGDYRLDRLSMEIDAIMFRIKYMTKHKVDLDKINYLKEIFTEKGIEIRKYFGEFLYNFLCEIITIPEPYHLEDIKDILAKDVKMDNTYVTFSMILLSDNKDYLEYVDNSFDSSKVYNMFPDKYFRFFTDSYNDGIAKAFPELFENKHQTEKGVGDDQDVYCHNFTFQVTEGCSLCCSYCYQVNKTPAVMNFETAKKFIDHLLNDDYGYINRYNSPAIIIEFIGGEPLLEIELIREIYEYFLDKCYELNHPWFTFHRVSICSNGLQYFNPEVQSFFKDYISQISFNISIDGNKELHDACRKQPNGEGSYDISMAALNHFNKHFSPERNSKMTLAPSNIEYLYDSVVDFIDNGMTVININCVFEEGWNQSTALEEYKQLKKLADYLLDNDLENLYIAIFNERQEDMMDKGFDSSPCGGGSASMLSMRPNGDFYPCIRYMPSSVGNHLPSMSIGNVDTGMIGRTENSEIIRQLDRNTRRAQNNDICYECPLSNDCAACAALGYQVFGVLNKKTTFICIQMIAEALANVYYWNMVNIKHPEYDLGVRKNVVPDEWSLLVIDKEELNYLKSVEMYSMIVTLENREK